jgi:hypothetical protein
MGYVLSMWQPWAWLVVHGPKNIENRTWVPPAAQVPLGYMFWIHAAKRRNDNYHWQVLRTAVAYGLLSSEGLPQPGDLQYGGLIGRARIVKIHKPVEGVSDRWLGWHMPDQYGWELEDRTPVPFRAMRGFQKFWKVPASLLG